MALFDPMRNFIYSAMNAYHSGKGANCLRKNDIDKGIYHLKQALSCSEKTANLANVAFSHETLADGYLCAGDYELAITHAERSCEFYEKIIQQNSSELLTKRREIINDKLRKIRFQSALQK